jgi:diacylglycerol O-acyltransferase
VPPLRRRLVTTPFNIDHPYWIEDPDFDLVHHLRHRAVPRPGDATKLRELVCELTSSPLDRNLPLWELHYVEGVAEGRVAVVSKVHHAAIDGVSGAEILSNLLDLTPEPRKVPPPAKAWVPDAVPSPLELADRSIRSLARRPGYALRLLKETLPVLVASGRAAWERRKLAEPRTGNGDASAPGTFAVAPRTRFNRQITARRAYAYGSLPLADIKAVKNVFATTVNDVVLAVCAEALRNYLAEKGELPAKPLIAGVPMSTRTDEQKGSGGNHVMFLRVSLHTDVEDPVARLRRINGEMRIVKERQRAVPANLMGDWAQIPAPALMARAARLYENFSIQDYHAPTFNVVISNVPGPPIPLYLAGARVIANHPISIPYHGLGLNITLFSYCGMLDYGITAHHDTVPDIEHFAGLMHAALATLLARTRA